MKPGLGFREREIPLHLLWTQLEQPPQKMKFVLTPLRHTAQRSSVWFFSIIAAYILIKKEKKYVPYKCPPVSMLSYWPYEALHPILTAPSVSGPYVLSAITSRGNTKLFVFSGVLWLLWLYQPKCSTPESLRIMVV